MSTLGLLPMSLVGSPGIGASRERALWLAGGWNRSKLPDAAAAIGLDRRTTDRLVSFANDFTFRLEQVDDQWLFSAIPVRERWRVLPLVLHKATALDIEVDAEGVIVLGVADLHGAESWFDGCGADANIDRL